MHSEEARAKGHVIASKKCVAPWAPFLGGDSHSKGFSCLFPQWHATGALAATWLIGCFCTSTFMKNCRDAIGVSCRRGGSCLLPLPERAGPAKNVSLLGSLVEQWGGERKAPLQVTPCCQSLCREAKIGDSNQDKKLQLLACLWVQKPRPETWAWRN